MYLRKVLRGGVLLTLLRVGWVHAAPNFLRSKQVGSGVLLLLVLLVLLLLLLLLLLLPLRLRAKVRKSSRSDAWSRSGSAKLCGAALLALLASMIVV